MSQTHYLLPIIHTADSTERNQYRNVQNREHKLPISVISHGLGHSNERTTEIYLKSIDISVIDKCNHEIISLLD